MYPKTASAWRPVRQSPLRIMLPRSSMELESMFILSLLPGGKSVCDGARHKPVIKQSPQIRPNEC